MTDGLEKVPARVQSVEQKLDATRAEHMEAAGLSDRDVQTMLDGLATVIEPIRLAYLWRPMLRDAADDMVLETAVNGQAQMLVTLNRRDFEPAARRFNLEIVSPAEAVTSLRRKR